MVGTQTITRRLATNEVEDVAREFADLVSVEQLTGLAFVSVATAGGVALAQQVVDLIIPRLPNDLRLSKDPRRARDFLAAGLLQGAWALLVGLVGIRFIGTRRSFLFATAIGLSIGAIAIAGANLIEWGQRVFGMLTAQLGEGEVLQDAKDWSQTQTATADESRAGGAAPVATDGGHEHGEDPNWRARAGSRMIAAVVA